MFCAVLGQDIRRAFTGPLVLWLLQTMMGRSPRLYIPSFVEIGPPVPEKKIFEGFLPYDCSSLITEKDHLKS